jgi:hypothetical protein
MFAHVTFPGRIGNDMTGPLDRWMPRGDRRNMAAIQSWAATVAASLPQPVFLGEANG